MKREDWRGFSGRKWLDEVNMGEFIQANYTGYDGNEDFLAGPTEATDKLWGRLKELQKEERAKGGVLDMETEVCQVPLLTDQDTSTKVLKTSKG